jgi:hypothetical protein
MGLLLLNSFGKSKIAEQVQIFFESVQRLACYAGATLLLYLDLAKKIIDTNR